MKVLLINIPFLFQNRYEATLWHCLGLLQIASYLRKHHHDVAILDSFREGYHNINDYHGLCRIGLPNSDIIKRIPEDTQLIGVSVPFSHFAVLAHELIESIKTHYPQIPLVLGGIYPSSQPESAVMSKADFVVLGEGEEPMLHLVNALSDGTSVEWPSVIKSKEDLNMSRSYFMKDLSKLPLPARDLVDFSKYVELSPRGSKGKRSASIVTSRGCPYDCGFCSIHPVSGYNWRAFSSQQVIKEINHLVDTYNINNLEIEDDNFTHDPVRAEEILNGIIEINKTKGYLSWHAQNGVRIDTLNENLVKLFKESNAQLVNLALEHGDEEMLKIIGKKLNLKKVEEVVRWYAKYGISGYLFMICGYPGETRKRHKKALKFYRKMYKIAPQLLPGVFYAQPYPNTKLYKLCVEKQYIDSDKIFDLHSHTRFSTENMVWIETKDFDKKEVVKRKDEILRIFKNYYEKNIKPPHRTRKMLQQLRNLLGHTSWLIGQQMQKTVPGLYTFLKKYL